MRSPILATIPIALLALALPAQAADECSQATPCTWFVDVDDQGIYASGDAAGWNFTRGDWFVLNATNFDDADHALTLVGYTVSLQVAAFGEAESPAFQFDKAGTFQLQDDKGHTAQVVVHAGDVNDQQAGLLNQSSSASGSGSATGKAPGIGVPLVLGAIVALAVIRRQSRS